MLKVNGSEMALPPDFTVAKLLARMRLPADRVAVERNGNIVPRKMFSAVMLEEGDRVEVVSFVGGG